MVTHGLDEASVLVLEDEAFLARQVMRELFSIGLKPVLAKNLAEARELMSQSSFDLAFFDIHLPDGRSIELLAESEITKQTFVVMMTAEGTLDIAIEAMRLGAVDFLCKPFDLQEITFAVKRVAERKRSKRLEQHRSEEFERNSGGLFMGSRLELIRKQIDRIVQAEQKLTGRLPPILIGGETGVGKTTIARWIHKLGTRGAQEMVEINCATLPESLAESELFGHEKGAFTDAKETKIGLLEAADGSTLFLDEITSLAPSIQAKLLTVLEDGAVRRVGGKRIIAVDVRIICASLSDLKTLVAKGEFREDLMHRLDLLRFRVPSLRELPDDLPGLAEHLLQKLSRTYGITNAKLSEVAHQRILKYEWPGNVRELSHELERALILEEPENLTLSQLGTLVGDCSDELVDNDSDWLRPDWRLPEEGISIEAVTSRFIELALDETNQNVSAAARRLGVPRDFIRYRLKKQDGVGE
ncbi:MAG: sigma-54-dependent transcriptional regulator [Opitutaceae bacterium]